MSTRLSLLSALACILAVGCAATPDTTSSDTQATSDDDIVVGSTSEALQAGPLFNLKLVDCVESVGVGLSPTALIRPRVPAQYMLASDPSSPVAPTAIRTAHCKHVSINGRDRGDVSLAQIGATIVSPDGTGDINNYQLWYYTDNLFLAAAFNLVGVPAQFTPAFKYGYDADDCAPYTDCAFKASPGPLSRPIFKVEGTVQRSDFYMTIPFVANWWYDGCRGTIKALSSGPGGGPVTLAFGSANLTATTPENSELAQAFGGSTIGFPILQQFNAAVEGSLTVSKQ
jgi:hypothetical protein